MARQDVQAGGPAKVYAVRRCTLEVLDSWGLSRGL